MTARTINGTGSASVYLPRACVLPQWGDPNAFCCWQIEKQGDVVWCRTHGGVDAIDGDDQ